jgi:replication factor C large subunit
MLPMVPLTRKYMPKSVSDIIGNADVREAARKWVEAILSGKKEKPLMVGGPSGVGKTSLAYALAKDFGLEMLEISSSGLRDKATLERNIRPAFFSKTVFGKKRIILVDDADAMTKDDRGGISELVELIKNASLPVIITANDTSEPKLRPLRMYVKTVQMKRIAPSEVANVLRDIAKKEKLDATEGAIMKIAAGCSGDLRSALNDLEATASGIRDRKIDDKSVLKTIFRCSTLSGARYASSVMDMDTDMLKLWLDENIAREYETPEEIAEAFNWLSRADVFDGRIFKRQYYGYMRYSVTLMTAGVGLSKRHVYNKPIENYQFPLYLVEMSRSMAARAMAKSVALKIGKRVHTSSKRVLPFLPLYAKLISREPEKAKIFYTLSDEEMEHLASLAN